MLAGLLRIPIGHHANEFIGMDSETSCRDVAFFDSIADFINGDCVDAAFFYLCVTSIIDGVLSQFVAISLVVLAVERCPVERESGIWYGVFLSCLELGNSVAGWITAPIVSALKITYSDFGRITDLIWIESCAKLGILLLVPLLLKKRRSEDERGRIRVRELETPLLHDGCGEEEEEKKEEEEGEV